MLSGHPDGRYGPLSNHLGPAIPIQEPQPRRPVGMPSFFSSSSKGSSILPLSRKDKAATAYAGGSPSLATSAKLSSRRLSASLGLSSKRLSNRFKIIIAGIIICAVIVITNNRSHTPSRRLRTRAQLGTTQKTYKVGGESNGLSLIQADEGQDEESWLDETESWFSQYANPDEDEDDWTNIDYTKMTEEEAKEKKEMVRHKMEVTERHRAESLRAIAWFLAEGGELPGDFEVPTKKQVNKMGGRGVESMLKGMDEKFRQEVGDDGSGEEIFEDGWAEFAKTRYRTVVFSKTYCPYSKRAKAILENYHLTPAPFVIELDIRPDGPKIQYLLEHLTSRRTVPNVLLDFVSIGGADDLTLMHAEGGLKRKFEEMQVLPGSRRPGMVAGLGVGEVGGNARQGRQAPAQVPVQVKAEDKENAEQDGTEDGDDLPDNLKVKPDTDAKAPKGAARKAADDIEADASPDGPDEEAKAREEDGDEADGEKDTAIQPAAAEIAKAEQVEKAEHKLGAFALQHADEEEEDDESDQSPAVEKKRQQIAQRVKEAAVREKEKEKEVAEKKAEKAVEAGMEAVEE